MNQELVRIFDRSIAEFFKTNEQARHFCLSHPNKHNCLTQIEKQLWLCRKQNRLSAELILQIVMESARLFCLRAMEIREGELMTDSQRIALQNKEYAIKQALEHTIDLEKEAVELPEWGKREDERKRQEDETGRSSHDL